MILQKTNGVKSVFYSGEHFENYVVSDFTNNGYVKLSDIDVQALQLPESILGGWFEGTAKYIEFYAKYP